MSDRTTDDAPPDTRILLLEGDSTQAGQFRHWMEEAGPATVTVAGDGAAARAHLEGPTAWDLIVTQVELPAMNGLEILRLSRDLRPRAPVLLLAQQRDFETALEAITLRADQLLMKPLTRERLLVSVSDLVARGRRRRERARLAVERDALHDALSARESRLRQQSRDLGMAQVEMLQRLAVAAEYRDDVTGRHAERVGTLASLLAVSAGLGAELARTIRRAAAVHDIGKIGIPDSILLKPGPLTRDEFAIIKRHTSIGAHMLAGSRFPLIELSREIAESHHERWDGSGYVGLRGKGIPVSGRLVAIADVFDSMTQTRPYKRAYPVDDVVYYVENERGRHFDPGLVDAFTTVVEAGLHRRLDELSRESPSSLLGRPEVRELTAVA